MSQVIYKNFDCLRKGYIVVKQFIEQETGEKILSLNTRIENDLGLSGDDNLELIEKFVKKYQLDTTDFNYSKHFVSESEILNAEATLWALVSIPFFLLFWSLQFLTFGKLNLFKYKFWPDEDENQNKADLSFGDMLSWYLTGKFKLRNEVKFLCK